MKFDDNISIEDLLLHLNDKMQSMKEKESYLKKNGEFYEDEAQSEHSIEAQAELYEELVRRARARLRLFKDIKSLLRLRDKYGPLGDSKY